VCLAGRRREVLSAGACSRTGVRGARAGCVLDDPAHALVVLDLVLPGDEHLAHRGQPVVGGDQQPAPGAAGERPVATFASAAAPSAAPSAMPTTATGAPSTAVRKTGRIG
jgi:hypothetical protein